MKTLRFSLWVLLAAGTVAGLAACGGAYGGNPASATPAPAPRAFSYRPFTASYHVVSHGSVEQSLGGQVNASAFALGYYLTVTARAGEQGFPVTLTVDSVPVLSGALAQIMASSGAELAGMSVTGTLLPSGEIRDLAGGDTTNNLVQQVLSGLRRLLPRVRPGGVGAGDQWSDTSETTTTQGGMDVTVHVVTHSEAVAWERHQGGEALHLQSVADYTLSGAGTVGGVSLTLDGSGRRHEQSYLGADGRYLGGVTVDTSHSTATIPATGGAVPIDRTAVDTISVIG
jgi:hypothetical protein